MRVFAQCSSALRKASSSVESSPAQKRRAELWLAERDRQARNVARIEKVEVVVSGPHKDHNTTIVLNKGHLVGGAVVQPLDREGAAVGPEEFWDLHRPFTSDAALRFQYYADGGSREFSSALNSAYWRSCSFVLGAILESAFRVPVALHSWPGADVRAGSFLYDARLEGVSGWVPSREELHILGRSILSALRAAATPIEPLVVAKAAAKEIFADAPFKASAIDAMAQKGVPPGSVRLYRMGDHVDISAGPMIPDSSHFGHFQITKVHEWDSDWGPLFRFQGVSVPAAQRVSAFVWEELTTFASLENRMPYPKKVLEEAANEAIAAPPEEEKSDARAS